MAHALRRAATLMACCPCSMRHCRTRRLLQGAFTRARLCRTSKTWGSHACEACGAGTSSGAIASTRVRGVCLASHSREGAAATRYQVRRVCAGHLRPCTAVRREFAPLTRLPVGPCPCRCEGPAFRPAASVGCTRGGGVPRMTERMRSTKICAPSMPAERRAA